MTSIPYCWWVKDWSEKVNKLLWWKLNKMGIYENKKGLRKWGKHGLHTQQGNKHKFYYKNTLLIGVRGPETPKGKL